MAEEGGWQNTTGGKVGLALLCVVALSVAIYEVKGYLHGQMPDDASTAMYIDSQTGTTFSHTAVVGETVPVTTPAGTQTGYPAVPCYWTADGQVKKDPTWVLMNTYIGKPGPTICPDCGRVVNPQLPPPRPGDRPPLTREELLQRNPRAFDPSAPPR